MSANKAVILDGTPRGDRCLDPVLGILTGVIGRTGAEIQTFPLRSIKIAHCLGCFECWVRTPGMCTEADANRDIVRAVVNCNTLVVFTPVTFGGYSPELKRLFDHMIQVTLPTFEVRDGELHHPPRYTRLPRFIVVGVQHEPNEEEARIFRALAGRNALNMREPSYAVEVVSSGEAAAGLARRFDALLTRVDEVPGQAAVTSLMPAPAASDPAVPGERRGRVLLIVGSPKVKRPSTSGVLGGYLLDRLKEQGWETESLTLRASLGREEGQPELLAATDRADLIVLAFPLYVDALPFLVTKAFTVLAAHRAGSSNVPRQRFAAICNSGFPETHQNSLALAMCRRFAAASRLTWAGCLALGGGEALSSGRPLEQKNRSGPPVRHVMQALRIAGAALAEGRPVPGEAVALMAKNPLPLPFAVWQWMFAKIGERGFRRQALGYGVSKRQMFARPYAGGAQPGTARTTSASCPDAAR